MSRRQYVCPTCGEGHSSLFAMMLCCDAVTNDLPLEDPPDYPHNVI